MYHHLTWYNPLTQFMYVNMFPIERDLSYFAPRGVFVHCLIYRHWYIWESSWSTPAPSTVSRSRSSFSVFGRILIPASGPFLCTVVIMVQGVYFFFLWHRHPIDAENFQCYAFTCCEFSPPHLNRARQNCFNRLANMPTIPCNREEIPPHNKIHVKALPPKTLYFAFLYALLDNSWYWKLNTAGH